MDRLTRVLTGGTLVMALVTVVAATGCRSMRNEVPPRRPYSTTGATPPPLGFNQEPRPNSSVGAGLYNSPTPGQPGAAGGPAQGTMPGLPGLDPTSPSAGSGPPQFGTPAPSSGNYGAPTGNRYGPSLTPGVPGSDSSR